MDKLETLKLFTRIVELGSFSKAANQMNIPYATASNAIKSLEKNLELRLLERTTRHVTPSSDGQKYYQHCVKILLDLENVESSLRNTSSQPRGILRVNLPTIQASKIVLPRIHEFHDLYPHIELIIDSEERLVDLVKEGIDCVIRSGELTDSSLICKRITRMPQVICASPKYIDTYGLPTCHEDLLHHRCVSFFTSHYKNKYPIEIKVNDTYKSFILHSWIGVNNAQSYVLCCLQGHGLIQVPRYHVAKKIQDGELIEILPDYKSTELAVSILYPQHKQTSTRLRVFIDWLTVIYKDFFKH